MKDLRLHFSDWYDNDLPGSIFDNIFTRILSKKFNVIIDNKNPDVVFFSLSGYEYLNYKNSLKIFVTSEPGYYNDLSKYDENHIHYKGIKNSDYMISSYKSTMPNNFYSPVFLLWLFHHIYVTKIITIQYLTEYRNPSIKNKFCIFLHRNHVPVKREEVYLKLNNYKHINTGNDTYIYPYGSIHKINVIKDFKFSFAFQNHFYKEHNEYNIPGLVDEKILESLISNTIPLYYGNENVCDFFNKNSFLNYHDYNDTDKFIEDIIKIDQNDKLSKDILSEPIVKNINDLKIFELEDFLLKIIN